MEERGRGQGRGRGRGRCHSIVQVGSGGFWLLVVWWSGFVNLVHKPHTQTTTHRNTLLLLFPNTHILPHTLAHTHLHCCAATMLLANAFGTFASFTASFAAF